MLISKSPTLIHFIKGRALSNAESAFQTPMSETDNEWNALQNPDNKNAAKQYVDKCFKLRLGRQKKVDQLKIKIENYIDRSIKLKLISRLIGL